ncbi:hypothetical protein DFQ28_003861 [Apophysomyces sp. BC1034]|nr:hypothetical protein DFQ30_001159 [Apophysomyces sp. BC1015]KAG0182195.1 hypothetical protein DFQ29_005411 [Apophysomyces sp. BC1021]KAG0193688.1 hypothetical protein DFQ28_003861 [Apophysomyces sp. BC1034]
MEKRQDIPCQDKGNGFAFCSPLWTDTWYNGSRYEFIWNYNNSERLNLFLYYKENFAYRSIKNWTNLTCKDGGLDVTVDNSWFPNQLDHGSGNKTWTLYGFYLPTGLDPTVQLVSPDSQFPRPFNFSVVQSAYAADGSGGDGRVGEEGVGSGNHQGSDPAASHGALLPGWAIAVVVIGSVALVATAATLIILAVLRTRRRKRTNKLMPSASNQDMARVDRNHDNLSKPAPLYDGGSIYSTTPMMAAEGNARFTDPPRLSALENSSRPSIAAYASTSKLSDGAMLTDTFRAAIQRPEWPTHENDEQRRRRLGEELLQQQLAEEGASVKHAERRPTRIQYVAGEESQAVLEHPSQLS